MINISIKYTHKLLLLSYLFIIIKSASLTRICINSNDTQQLNEFTWLHNYTNFNMMLPHSSQYQVTSSCNNDQRQLFLDILKAYPRNYQTLFILHISGYGLEQNIAGQTYQKQQDSIPKYISLKKLKKDYKQTKKNLYLNKIENKFDLFNLNFQNSSSIKKGSPRDEIYTPYFYKIGDRQIKQTAIEVNLQDFLEFYLGQHISNAQRIKNLAIFIEFSQPEHFKSFMTSAQAITDRIGLKIQIIAMINRKWPKSNKQIIDIKISHKLKFIGHQIIIKQSTDQQIKYVLIEDKGVKQGIFSIKVNDMFIFTVQKA